MNRIPLLIAVAMLITLSTGNTLAATCQMDHERDGSNPKSAALCKQKCGGNGGGERKRSGSGGNGERKRDGSGSGDCRIVG
jgi:hypothetical protein